MKQVKLAWDLWRSDSPLETVLSLVVIVALFAPLLALYLRSNGE